MYFKLIIINIHYYPQRQVNILYVNFICRILTALKCDDIFLILFFKKVLKNSFFLGIETQYENKDYNIL